MFSPSGIWNGLDWPQAPNLQPGPRGQAMNEDK